jgi:hypothetical protein
MLKNLKMIVPWLVSRNRNNFGQKNVEADAVFDTADEVAKWVGTV